MDMRFSSYQINYRSVIVSRQISGRQTMLGDGTAEGFWDIPCTGQVISLDNLKWFKWPKKYDETGWAYPDVTH